MKATQLKLKVSLNESACQSIDTIFKSIETKLNNPLQFGEINISNKLNLEEVKATILEKYEDVSISEGCLQGCYGSNTGSYDKGLTVHFDEKYVIDRYIDSEYGEQVNPWHLFLEHGQLAYEDLEDSDALLDSFEHLGLEIKSDNTYNFATDFGSESSDCAGFMYDFQFDLIKDSNEEFGPCIVKVMFHLGGDPRGNYTRDYFFKFDSVEDFYSVIFPTKFLSDEN